MLPRTLLFLVPTLAVCMAAGCRAVFDRRPGLATGTSIVILLALVFTAEAASTVRALRAVRPDDGIKPIMATLAERQRPGDTIYLSLAAQYPFAHYLQCRCAGPRVARAVREGLWKVKPVPGNVAQWSPALSSSTRRFRIGVFRGYDQATCTRNCGHFRAGEFGSSSREKALSSFGPLSLGSTTWAAGLDAPQQRRRDHGRGLPLRVLR